MAVGFKRQFDQHESRREGEPTITAESTYNVLMVCTGNICRSPMAAGLLAHFLPSDLKGRIAVTSAGTGALHGHQAEAFAIEAMAALGIDIRDHRARQLTSSIARSADLILVMEAMHAGIVKRFLGWGRGKPRMISEFNPESPIHDVQDPFGHPLEAYRTCIQTLQPCIRGLILWLGSNVQ